MSNDAYKLRLLDWTPGIGIYFYKKRTENYEIDWDTRVIRNRKNRDDWFPISPGNDPRASRLTFLNIYNWSILSALTALYIFVKKQ